MNGRAGQNIVELVQEHELPHGIERLLRIAHCLLRQDGQQLQIHQSKLGFAVCALVSCHRGQCSSVILEVQLSFPDRKPFTAADTLFQLIKESPRKRLTHFGDSLDAFFHTNRGLEHFPCRTAAAVAISVRYQNIIVDILVLVAHPAAHDRIGMQHSIVGCKEVLDWLVDAQRRDQVCQYLRAVDSSPHHCIVGNLVELVPSKLCRHKVVNAALFHNLWQCTRVAKHVGQPQNAVIHAKLLLEKALAMHELAHERLA